MPPGYPDPASGTFPMEAGRSLRSVRSSIPEVI